MMVFSARMSSLNRFVQFIIVIQHSAFLIGFCLFFTAKMDDIFFHPNFVFGHLLSSYAVSSILTNFHSLIRIFMGLLCRCLTFMHVLCTCQIGLSPPYLDVRRRPPGKCFACDDYNRCTRTTCSSRIASNWFFSERRMHNEKVPHFAFNCQLVSFLQLVENL